MPRDPRAVRVPYSAITFSRSAARYRLPAGGPNGGRFVSYDSVRRIIEDDIAATQERMAGIGAQLQAGSITVAEFRERTALELRSLHLAQYAAGKGGFHNMTAADFGRVGSELKAQYKYLNDWCVRMAAQPELINDGVPGQMRFKDRLGLYSESGLSSFESGRLVAEREAGYAWEVNEPESQPCTGANSCTEQTERGEVPIGSLLLPGKRRCKSRCRCKIRRTKARVST